MKPGLFHRPPTDRGHCSYLWSVPWRQQQTVCSYMTSHWTRCVTLETSDRACPRSIAAAPLFGLNTPQKQTGPVRSSAATLLQRASPRAFPPSVRLYFSTVLDDSATQGECSKLPAQLLHGVLTSGPLLFVCDLWVAPVPCVCSVEFYARCNHILPFFLKKEMF